MSIEFPKNYFSEQSKELGLHISPSKPFLCKNVITQKLNDGIFFKKHLSCCDRFLSWIGWTRWSAVHIRGDQVEYINVSKLEKIQKRILANLETTFKFKISKKEATGAKVFDSTRIKDGADQAKDNSSYISIIIQHMEHQLAFLGQKR